MKRIVKKSQFQQITPELIEEKFHNEVAIIYDFAKQILPSLKPIGMFHDKLGTEFTVNFHFNKNEKLVYELQYDRFAFHRWILVKVGNSEVLGKEQVQDFALNVNESKIHEALTKLLTDYKELHENLEQELKDSFEKEEKGMGKSLDFIKNIEYRLNRLDKDSPADEKLDLWQDIESISDDRQRKRLKSILRSKASDLKKLVKEAQEQFIVSVVDPHKAQEYLNLDLEELQNKKAFSDLMAALKYAAKLSNTDEHDFIKDRQGNYLFKNSFVYRSQNEIKAESNKRLVRKSQTSRRYIVKVIDPYKAKQFTGSWQDVLDDKEFISFQEAMKWAALVSGQEPRNGIRRGNSYAFRNALVYDKITYPSKKAQMNNPNPSSIPSPNFNNANNYQVDVFDDNKLTGDERDSRQIEFTVRVTGLPIDKDKMIQSAIPVVQQMLTGRYGFLNVDKLSYENFNVNDSQMNPDIPNSVDSP